MIKGGLHSTLRVTNGSMKLCEKLLIKEQDKFFDHQLKQLGFKKEKLSNDVLNVLKMAESDINTNVYNQCALEEVNASKEEIYTQLSTGECKGLSVIDIQKINNLSYAWSFLIQEEVVQIPSCFEILSALAKLVNAGLFQEPNAIRNSDVRIGGSSYIPPLPDKVKIIKDIKEIILANKSDVDIAIELCLYIMKSQIFIDGNKRVAILFANHYLMHTGSGLMIVDANNVRRFKNMLVDYYEDKDSETIKKFLKEECFYSYKNIAI